MEKVDVLLIQISTTYIHWTLRSNEPQLGQYYIAEYAYHKGFNIKIKKYASDEPLILPISNLLDEFDCNMLGFYVDSENIWTIRRIVYEIKRRRSDLVVFVGGPQVTGNPQKALSRLPDVDFSIVGEGEITLTEVLEKMKGNSICSAISSTLGIAYIDKNGCYNFTGNRPQIDNLDLLPYPVRERYSLDKDISFCQILTGRGCVGECAFCFEGSKTNNKFRMRSAENVCEELDYLIKRLPEHSYIIFLDDTFIINPDQTTKICNWLIEHYKGKIYWYCEARVDILLRNLDLLPLMKKAGLVRIQLGGESGSQSILDAYKKGMKIEDLIKVVNEIYRVGIDSVYINFIVGGAFETEETFSSTLELAKKLLEIAPGCAEVGSSIFTPYEGSPMCLDPEKYGIHIKDRNILTGPDGFTAFVETDALTLSKISQLKIIFDNEINSKLRELLTVLPHQLIVRHFELEHFFNITTMWYEKLSTIESLKNYFGAIFKQNFHPISEVDSGILLNSIPYRTEQPISDGESFFRRVLGVNIVKNTQLENDILFLSSGKIALWEIVEILSKKYSDNVNLLGDAVKVYEQFDKEFLIVWKTGN